jgi:hypothetical protein
MGRIVAISRRMGVSKNDVVNILVAGALARGELPGTVKQRTTDLLVATALDILREESVP